MIKNRKSASYYVAHMRKSMYNRTPEQDTSRAGSHYTCDALTHVKAGSVCLQI
jgi:hypothetical protein